jgi:hypothetical protein
MTERPRDWDRELEDIDRTIEKEGPPQGAVSRAPALPSGAAARPAPASPAGKGSVAMTWFWVLLAVLLAVALPFWPYGKECGLQLFFYIGAAALALLAGVAGAVSSWSTHRGLAHGLALLVVIWAGVMGAREVLPRIGYAGEAKAWLCPATPEPQPPASGSVTPPSTEPATPPSSEPATPPGSEPATPPADAP